MTPLIPGRDTPRAGGALAELAIEKRSSAGVAREFVVTERQLAGEPLSSAFRRLATELYAREAELLSLMIYGASSARTGIEGAMREALGRTDWPVTWIDGASCDGAALAGLQAFAVSGRPVTRVRLGNRVVGSVFADEGARHCLLGGLGPTAAGLPPAAQVQQTLGNLEWALERVDFKLSDVVRTWFYNDDVLAWYDEFNRVRSAHYAPVAFRTGSLPASTGIGTRSPGGAAVVVGAWAMQPLDPNAYAKEIGSPLQCPAPAYGSSFSRAMEVRSGRYRRLFVSGTASIFPDGTTAWVNDAGKQVALTMEVVTAILHSRVMGYFDVTRATAYFKKPIYKSHFDAWCVSRELTHLPVVALQADVCRDDLLFEIELDAVVPAGR